MAGEIIPILLCGIVAGYINRTGGRLSLLRLNRYEDPDSKNVITRLTFTCRNDSLANTEK